MLFNSLYANRRKIMGNYHLDGKFLTQWEKSDTTRTKVMNKLNKDGNPCQVADAAFNTQCFKIIEG
jgi:hypothetical protein